MACRFPRHGWADARAIEFFFYAVLDGRAIPLEVRGRPEHHFRVLEHGHHEHNGLQYVQRGDCE